MAHHNIRKIRDRMCYSMSIEREEAKAWDRVALQEGIPLSELIRRTMREKFGTSQPVDDPLGSQARSR